MRWFEWFTSEGKKARVPVRTILPPEPPEPEPKGEPPLMMWIGGVLAHFKSDDTIFPDESPARSLDEFTDQVFGEPEPLWYQRDSQDIWNGGGED